MRFAAAALVLVALAAASCGDSAPVPDVEVHGTPLRRAAPPEAEPPPAAIGDVDPGPAPEPAPLFAPTAQAPASAPSAAPNGEPKCEYVTFDDLSGFDYDPAADAKREIPAKVRALSGRDLAVEGYIMPLAYEAGGVRKFLLMKNQFGCCFAVTPKLNEWVEVTMEGGSVAEYAPHVLVTVWGRLDVTEELKGGVVAGLYRMTATRTEFTEAR
jgi:hypothetical protein